MALSWFSFAHFHVCLLGFKGHVLHIGYSHNMNGCYTITLWTFSSSKVYINHTHGQFSSSGSSQLHIFGQWKNTGGNPGETHIHREKMHKST